MAKNKKAKAAMENFKMEAANEVGVNLKQGYNGDLTSKQAGSIRKEAGEKRIAFRPFPFSIVKEDAFFLS